MANENDIKKQLEQVTAERDALKVEVAKLQGALEMAEKLAKGSGPSVLVNSADASEAAKAAARHDKLREMRAQAMEIAGPNAQTVKYIVGPSGTVRPDVGPVKAGTVIEVPVSELPAGEWKVWTPDFQPPKAPRAALTARDIQAGNRMSAAEKAIAQRDALKAQLRDS